MDGFLAGRGYWAAWAAVVAGGVLGGEGEHRALGYGAGFLLGVAGWACVLRAAALRGDRQRQGRPPPPRVATVRRTVVRLRWPVAVAYAAAAAWFAQWHYDVPWFSAVAGLVALAVAAYAARPLTQG